MRIRFLVSSALLVYSRAFVTQRLTTLRSFGDLQQFSPSSSSSPSCCSRFKKQTSQTLQASASGSVETSPMRVGYKIGSGSYGTVHVIKNDQKEEVFIGKRSWNLQEIKEKFPDATDEQHKEKHGRCLYYWKVEKHCADVLPSHPGIPTVCGTFTDSKEGHTWLLFKMIPPVDTKNGGSPAVALPEPAPSMQDLLELDLLDHQQEIENRMLSLASALGLAPDGAGDVTYLVKTVDQVIEQTLEILIHLHKNKIVHRDLKPGNLLVADGRLHLIDFGSATDLKTAGVLKANIGLSEKVAISPIYAAPEIFVDASLPRTAVNFDCFSAALIFCQIMFQYLDERTDAGFFQQLAEADYSLDSWLDTELSQDVRSSGLEEGLSVLAERPGLWDLLQNMLRSDPRDRYSSERALEEWKKITRNLESNEANLDHAALDGEYLADVLESFELCSVTDMETGTSPVIRPLHFVATFRRKESLGLLLAEMDGELPEEMSEADRKQWNSVTEEALPGQVFIQGVVPGSQADVMEIFEVGDRLQGVGELPLAEGGFEKAIELLQDQPRNSKFVTLHIDRRPSSIPDTLKNDLTPIDVRGMSIVRDQGAWTTRGRRSSQEDRFVLNEIHDTEERSIIVGGVFDGHLGTAASDFVSERLSSRMAASFVGDNSMPLSLDAILRQSWDEICTEYRASCSVSGECVAQYDAAEGKLDAYTGGRDAVAGTTGSVVALEINQGLMAVLNCGDSRSLVFDEKGDVIFRTNDHQPEYERERFLKGIKDGLPYSEPECRFSKWRVAVGDYNYAVSRSLEGPFATNMGIISEPDVNLMQFVPGSIVMMASDGLWEVMDVEETGRVLKKLRQMNVLAADAAKILCSTAFERGSKDNVSAVVLYVD